LDTNERPLNLVDVISGLKPKLNATQVNEKAQKVDNLLKNV
jgi:hypothetical protein